MMTLEEAIKHAEEVARSCEFDTDCGMANHFIDRSGVADVIKCGEEHRQLAEWLKELRDYKEQKLPSAQPDGIPLEWIDKHLEWLDNCDNDFAQLAKVGIRMMVEIWKKDKTR